MHRQEEMIGDNRSHMSKLIPSTLMKLELKMGKFQEHQPLMFNFLITRIWSILLKQGVIKKRWSLNMTINVLLQAHLVLNRARMQICSTFLKSLIFKKLTLFIIKSMVKQILVQKQRKIKKIFRHLIKFLVTVGKFNQVHK